eukprot:TRINITY_DN4374_c1_g1_i1.p1 TRINITY_DN4374_c1_g1~~TRINITY_DN4374_c1_g1_i1.p1  ORF type:complete len:176 (+),score=24.30 TRINITY_DN4374_c1_g1_i1:48-575(+)
MFRAVRVARCLPTVGARGMVGDKYKQTAARVEKTDTEWKELLTQSEYEVLREAHTDKPGGGYSKMLPKEGYFQCRACGTPLYNASSKFACSCGWPAFSKSFQGHVTTKVDTSIPFTPRTEILCAGCDGHLGHVFCGERLCDTNERHCVNTSSIHYIDTLPPNLPEGTVAVDNDLE